MLPEDALLFADWGTGRVYCYLQTVEGIRRDVEVRTWMPRRPDMYAGVPEFFVSILPVWEEPRKRLGKLAEEAKEVESGLFQFRK